jgi:hypothetical protein
MSAPGDYNHLGFDSLGHTEGLGDIGHFDISGGDFSGLDFGHFGDFGDE